MADDENLKKALFAATQADPRCVIRETLKHDCNFKSGLSCEFFRQIVVDCPGRPRQIIHEEKTRPGIDWFPPPDDFISRMDRSIQEEYDALSDNNEKELDPPEWHEHTPDPSVPHRRGARTAPSKQSKEPVVKG